MHEIRATLEAQYVAETVRLARAAGIDRVSVSDVYVHGPDERRQVVSVETSTPKARAFVEALLTSSQLPASSSITSRELRAIIDGSDLAQLTSPMSEPFPDIVQDLWQLSHITASYAGRAAAGAILLADGIITNNPVAIVVAALFLPFLAEVLSVSLGIWTRDRRLIARGLTAIAVSTVLAFAGGLAVGLATTGPILFDNFRSPLTGFVLSAIIGITAGLSDADDTGRRYLIGVAAAVQLAIVPVWLGAAVATGLPASAILSARLIGFGLNLIAIAGGALLAFASLHFRQTGSLRAPRSSGRG